MGYKAGMTHVVREIDRPGSKLHKKEAVEAVTILETPPMVVVGIVGYVETPTGLRTLTTVWANHLSDDIKRRFYKNWYRSKRKAFTKYAKKAAEKPQEIAAELERIRSSATVIRVLAHTQIRKVKLRQKVANLLEIQVNGGSAADKVEFALHFLSRRSKFRKSSLRERPLTSARLPAVMDLPVLSVVGELPVFLARPIVAFARLLALVLGILPVSDIHAPELVNRATITELRSTSAFFASARRVTPSLHQLNLT